MRVVGSGNDTPWRLRARKRREEKPFALMYLSLEAASRAVEISPEEAKLLGSQQAPIVLLRRRNAAAVAPSVAPENPNLGVMLPYTPLHQLLMAELTSPIVATRRTISWRRCSLTRRMRRRPPAVSDTQTRR